MSEEYINDDNDPEKVTVVGNEETEPTEEEIITDDEVIGEEEIIGCGSDIMVKKK